MAGPVLEKTEEELEQERVEAEAADLAKRKARGDFVDEDGAGEGTDPEALKAMVEAEENGGKKPKKKTDDAEGDEEREPVPYARFKEVIGERDKERDDRIRAEGRAAAAEDLAKSAPKAAAPAVEAKPEVDVKDLRKKERQAMLDGDVDKAAEYGDAADNAIYEKARKDALKEATTTTNAVLAQEKLTNAADAVVEKYPFLDSRNEATLDKAAVAEVLEWRDFYTGKGYSMAAALTKAADKVCAPILKAKGNGEDDDKGDKPDKGKEREQQAILRGARAADQQPARASGGKGDRSAQAADPDVAKMSDDDFARLTKAEKSRLRGDTV